MNASVELLFDEFARVHLERAGKCRDELARLLDGFLVASPVQLPGRETLAVFAGLLPDESETPPLLAERVRRGWRREEIVDWIRERFGIGEEKREKVAGYWHELETGLVPVSGVSVRLREALFERFGEAVEAAAQLRPASGARVGFRRLQDQPSLAQAEMPAAPQQAPEPDEVDALFGRRS